MSKHFSLAVAFAGLFIGVLSQTRADDPFSDENDSPVAVRAAIRTQGLDRIVATPLAEDGSNARLMALQAQPALFAQLTGGDAAVDPFGNPMIAWSTARHVESGSSLQSGVDPVLPSPILASRSMSNDSTIHPQNDGGPESEKGQADAAAGRSRTPPQTCGEGTVQGRLLHRGRPLADCRVVLVPMRRNGWGYCYDEESQPLDATTDNDGAYRFDNVPSGSFKLTWLPPGTRQWIRRIAMKPDVVVHGAEWVDVKDIAALRTVN